MLLFFFINLPKATAFASFGSELNFRSIQTRTCAKPRNVSSNVRTTNNKQTFTKLQTANWTISTLFKTKFSEKEIQKLYEIWKKYS